MVMDKIDEQVKDPNLKNSLWIMQIGTNDKSTSQSPTKNQKKRERKKQRKLRYKQTQQALHSDQK